MNGWTAAELAEAAGGRLVAGDPETPGPASATIDSREAGPGVLFVGLPGEKVDGGSVASQAIELDPPERKLRRRAGDVRAHQVRIESSDDSLLARSVVEERGMLQQVRVERVRARDEEDRARPLAPAHAAGLLTHRHE